jgi:hypothetical protein
MTRAGIGQIFKDLTSLRDVKTFGSQMIPAGNPLLLRIGMIR